MLSGSAFLRVSVLLVVAGALAALVQVFWPRTGSAPAPAPSGTASSRQAAPAEAPPTPRRVETAARPAPAPSPPPPVPAAEPATSPEPLPGPAASREPPDTLPQQSPPVAADPPAPPAPTGQAAVESANDAAGPRAVALVDLNTGSLSDLNRLRGGGNIGRAIVQHRPYTAVDQLLSKRVLSRATYERIKDQVSVQ